MCRHGRSWRLMREWRRVRRSAMQAGEVAAPAPEMAAVGSGRGERVDA